MITLIFLIAVIILGATFIYCLIGCLRDEKKIPERPTSFPAESEFIIPKIIDHTKLSVKKGDIIYDKHGDEFTVGGIGNGGILLLDVLSYRKIDGYEQDDLWSNTHKDENVKDRYDDWKFDWDDICQFFPSIEKEIKCLLNPKYKAEQELKLIEDI